MLVGETHVQKLVESIKLVGLRCPINIRGGMFTPPILISGAHRLEAIKRLGWEMVSAIALDSENEIDDAIAEIDENLVRRNLTAAEEALALERRAELIAAKAEAEAEAAKASAAPIGAPLKRNPKGGGNAGKPGPAPASHRDLAARTGMSEGRINRARQRVKALPL